MWPFSMWRSAQTYVAAKGSLLLLLLLLKKLQDTACYEAHPTLLKPVHSQMSVNSQLAAAHSICGTTTTVTKLLMGTRKMQVETDK